MRRCNRYCTANAATDNDNNNESIKMSRLAPRSRRCTRRPSCGRLLAAPANQPPRIRRPQTYGHTDIQAYKHINIQTYRRTDIRAHRHTDTQTYGQTDIGTSGHTHTHTHTETYTHTDTRTYGHRDIRTYIRTFRDQSIQTYTNIQT